MYIKSITDILSDALSPVLRKISDLNSNLFGTEVEVMRIRKVPAGRQQNTNRPISVLGDYNYDFESQVIGNCSITYPFNEIRIFAYRGSSAKQENNQEIAVTGIPFEEILPIKMTLNFGSFGGTYESDPVILQEGDLILDIFYDEYKNCIPVLLEFKKFTASLFAKNIVTKTAELSVVRGKVEQDIDKLIQDRIKLIQEREKENFKNRVI